MAHNVSAVPEPVRGVVGVFGVERTGWFEGSAATEARNGLLAAGGPITSGSLILHYRPEPSLKYPLG